MPLITSVVRLILKSLNDIIYFYISITLSIESTIAGNNKNKEAIPIKLHGLRPTPIYIV